MSTVDFAWPTCGEMFIEFSSVILPVSFYRSVGKLIFSDLARQVFAIAAIHRKFVQTCVESCSPLFSESVATNRIRFDSLVSTLDSLIGAANDRSWTSGRHIRILAFASKSAARRLSATTRLELSRGAAGRDVLQFACRRQTPATSFDPAGLRSGRRCDRLGDARRVCDRDGPHLLADP